jgi:hypothetical protein
MECIIYFIILNNIESIKRNYYGFLAIYQRETYFKLWFDIHYMHIKRLIINT